MITFKKDSDQGVVEKVKLEKAKENEKRNGRNNQDSETLISIVSLLAESSSETENEKDAVPNDDWKHTPLNKYQIDVLKRREETRAQLGPGLADHASDHLFQL
jgi:hypothetical protein